MADALPVLSADVQERLAERLVEIRRLYVALCKEENKTAELQALVEQQRALLAEQAAALSQCKCRPAAE